MDFCRDMIYVDFFGPIKLKIRPRQIRCIFLTAFLFFGVVAPRAIGQSAHIFTESFNAGQDSTHRSFFPIDTVFYPVLKSVKPSPVIVEKEGIPVDLKNKDNNFYFLSFLLLFTGVIISLYPKFISELLRSFFRSGFLSRSLSDQLFQNTQVSFLLNFVFFVIAGTYLFLQIQHFSEAGSYSDFVNIPLCIVFVAIIYGVKYLVLVTTGWLLGLPVLMKTYSRVIFVVNKAIGLGLLPVLAFLMLGQSSVVPFFSTISLIFIGLMFIVRYFMVWPQVRSLINISSFHFFIYLCTFEILPLLIMGKLLVNFL